jgi:hypothetical protein
VYRGPSIVESFEDVIEGFKLKIFRFGHVLVGIPTDIGPRILYLALDKDKDFNLFGVVPSFAVETPEGVWRIYGGHRLWTSPEAMPRSYSLDDKPVKIVVRDDEVVVEGNPEPQNSVQKRFVIRRGPDDYSVEVVHEITNIGRWSIEFACWALSVMRVNGFAIIPIKPRCVDEKCLLPDRSLALWPYTKLTDKRLVIEDNYLFVKQDPKTEKPFKIGVKANPNWAAYYVENFLFIKIFRAEEAVYPDFNSLVEVYTNNLFLELETLGPLRRVEPGDINRHREIWSIAEIGPLTMTEKDVEEKVAPIVSELLKL